MTEFAVRENSATPARNARTREEWARIINADWRKSVEAIFATADSLIQAREELGAAMFNAMVEGDLDFSPGVARKIMKISRDQRLNSPAAGELPASWAVLEELSSLSDDDFEWARERGLIDAKTTQRTVRAVRKRKDVPEGQVMRLGENPRHLPGPAEAKRIARATNRLVAASDGHFYSGATDEERAEYLHRREQTYKIIDAVTALDECPVSADEWVQQSESHWIHKFHPSSIDGAVEFLMGLQDALNRSRGFIDADTGDRRLP